MNKFFDKVCDALPILWGLLLVVIITTGGVALAITTVKWLLAALGVM